MSTTKLIIVGTNSEVRSAMKALVMGNPKDVRISDIKGCAAIVAGPATTVMSDIAELAKALADFNPVDPLWDGGLPTPEAIYPETHALPKYAEPIPIEDLNVKMLFLHDPPSISTEKEGRGTHGRITLPVQELY